MSGNHPLHIMVLSVYATTATTAITAAAPKHPSLLARDPPAGSHPGQVHLVGLVGSQVSVGNGRGTTWGLKRHHQSSSQALQLARRGPTSWLASWLRLISSG
ncbi:hypothetical protein BDZ45DRAFT_692732 [Acephala macrosclerotiorum]|nr:hypothetical protein BDZ45DRAFT_692732 [Acephala macrosclerotiorum]